MVVRIVFALAAITCTFIAPSAYAQSSGVDEALQAYNEAIAAEDFDGAREVTPRLCSYGEYRFCALAGRKYAEGIREEEAIILREREREDPDEEFIDRLESIVGMMAPAAIGSWRDGCLNGFLESCHLLAQFNRQGVLDVRDPEGAFQIFSALCNEEQYAPGCEDLGYVYIVGDGVDQDVYQGLDILAPLCRDGRGWSCFYIASVYENGIGAVSADPSRYEYYRDLACEHGHSASC